MDKTHENDIVYWADEYNDLHVGVVVSPIKSDAVGGDVCRVRDFRDEFGLSAWMQVPRLHPTSEEAMEEACKRIARQKTDIDIMVATGADSLIGKIHRSQVEKCHRTVNSKDMLDLKDRLQQLARICAERITAIDAAKEFMGRYPDEKKDGFDEKVEALLTAYRPICAVLNGLFAETKTLNVEE